METYHGHVKTPADAIILFEACRLGVLPRVQRRLSEKERQSIKSGSVFVWDEREAGMRRWTDGKSWSASRVSGSFLTYREMEGKRGGNNIASQVSARMGKTPDSTKGSDSDADGAADDGPDGYRYKPDGLMKQSFSITTSTGNHLHLISYYSRSHPQAHQLMTPSNDPALRHIRPPKGMYPESTVQDQQSIPAVTRAPMPMANQMYMPPGYPQRGLPIGAPPPGAVAYGQPPYMPPGQWQGPPATSAPNGYVPYPQGTGAPLPHSGPPPQGSPYPPAMPPLSHVPVTSAPAMDPHHARPPMVSHQRTGSGSSYPSYGSARPSPRNAGASLAPPLPGSRHASQANSPAGTPPMHQIDPAMGHPPFNGNLPPVRTDPSTRTPSPAPKRDWTGTPVQRDVAPGSTIPSIGSLMNAAGDPLGRSPRSTSNSPAQLRRDGPQDIPHDKLGFGEDMRALRVLDRAFKT